jgi:hypothetical protein
MGTETLAQASRTVVQCPLGLFLSRVHAILGQAPGHADKQAHALHCLQDAAGMVALVAQVELDHQAEVALQAAETDPQVEMDPQVEVAPCRPRQPCSRCR